MKSRKNEFDNAKQIAMDIGYQLNKRAVDAWYFVLLLDVAHRLDTLDKLLAHLAVQITLKCRQLIL